MVKLRMATLRMATLRFFVVILMVAGMSGMVVGAARHEVQRLD